MIVKRQDLFGLFLTSAALAAALLASSSALVVVLCPPKVLPGVLDVIF